MIIDTTHGHELFYRFVQRACALHAAKNQDYGGGNPLGNFLECEAQGLPPVRGIMVRISDKYSRLNSLIKKGGEGEVKDESIIDTFLDLGNYAFLAAVLFELYGLELSTAKIEDIIEFTELPSEAQEGLPNDNYPLTNAPFQRTCSTCQHYHISFNEMPCKKCIDKDGLLPHWRGR